MYGAMKLRLYLLPITSRRVLLYAHRSSNAPASVAQNPPGQASSAGKRRIEARRPSLIDRVTDRANAIWVKWESREKGWQRTVTQWGNKVFARISYQEWGLKSLGPSRDSDDALSADGASPDSPTPVKVILPRGLGNTDTINKLLFQLGTERQRLHRRGLFLSLLAIPLTIPIALIPFVPNLPFFYAVFRSYSHWRALAGSHYLVSLVSNKRLDFQYDDLLASIYRRGGLSTREIDQLYAEYPREPGQGQVYPRALQDLWDSVSADPRAKVSLEEAKMQGGARDSKDAGNANHPAERLLTLPKIRLLRYYLCLPGVQVELERALAQVQQRSHREGEVMMNRPFLPFKDSTSNSKRTRRNSRRPGSTRKAFEATPKPSTAPPWLDRKHDARGKRKDYARTER